MDRSSKSDAGPEAGQGGVVQQTEHQNPTAKPPVVVGHVNQEHPELYMEALARYPNDESIDAGEEKRLVRKLDMRLLPLLGICYFFYYVDKTTLSYAAIFGLKDGLALKGDEYAWLSSSFYFGWLGFSRDERLIMIARMRRNQTGVEQRRISWPQVREAYADYKTWLFTLLGFVANIPNGGISNFSTLVIQGLGFNTLETALLGIPQGALVVIWIGLGALANRFMPNNCRTLVCAMFMVPTIGGALGFLLAPPDAYVGRLICFYLTGSYQASFVISLSLITSNTGGQSKKMIVSGMIWFGACVGNIISPFFYRSEQAPKYPLGIGSLLVANCVELALFFVFRYAFIWENKKKERERQRLRDSGVLVGEESATAFTDLTDKENPNFVYVY
ncbi:hypothetical protein MAPG_01887 [Magnaporthiopsis poae ATCC 64411]|uniref:Allantoate permease n=1 Tax=Magnaporthiopsis poae (strain ATCC 64411 / 73-15) TaxID=644358 RepID=A0A0C4DPV8_MAGP6|nr:hypothetical protein MAPG_01887 [Magnaporthiopsis poae ATCC 64411]